MKKADIAASRQIVVERDGADHVQSFNASRQDAVRKLEVVFDDLAYTGRQSGQWVSVSDFI